MGVSFNDTHMWRGVVRVTVRRHDRPYNRAEFAKLIGFGYIDDEKIVDMVEFDNLIVNTGKNHFRDVLSGAVVDGEIKALAWGLSNTAPNISQTRLVTESGRKQVTNQRNGASVGQLITTVYIAPTEGNVSIRELGWFAGPSTSFVTPNTGTMIARVLYTRDKNQLESIQVDRTDTIA